MNKFNGEILHSFEYKNAQQFDSNSMNENKRFLIIGCGNSAIEIAGELKLHNMKFNQVSILVRNGRYFTRESTKYRFEKFLDFVCNPSPFSEQSLLKDNILCCKDIEFHREIIKFDGLSNYLLFTDLSEYGIKQPKLSATADHYYNKKLAIVDRNTIPLIKKRLISIINMKEIASFSETGVVFNDGSTQEFDVVIFATGYRHGLEQLFIDDDGQQELWTAVSTMQYNYPLDLFEIIGDESVYDVNDFPMKRNYAWPDTNGRSRSNVYSNLYFAGFDEGYLGGLSIGIYSWAIGEEIAVKLGYLSVADCTIPWLENESSTEIAVNSSVSDVDIYEPSLHLS